MPGRGMAAMPERGAGCRVRPVLGAYVLGGLPAAEADAVRRHLTRCVSCRDEHDRLAGVLPWLSLLSPGGELAGQESSGDAPEVPPSEGEPDEAPPS